MSARPVSLMHAASCESRSVVPLAIEAIRWDATTPGAGWVQADGAWKAFYSTRHDNQLELWLDGERHVFELATQGPQRQTGGAAQAFDGGVIKAPMPGTVLNIMVAEGDTVEANAPLVVMESMKMEMTLSAPVAGQVKAVHAKPDQAVDMGTVLVELEPDA